MMKKTLLFAVLFSALFNISALGQNFEMYVSDAGNFDSPPWQILKFDENGENGEVFTDEALGWPQDIIILEDQGILIVTNLNNDNITKYDIETGEYLGVYASGIDGPTRMKIGADSLLYVLPWNGGGKVMRFNLDGSFEDEFTSTGLNSSIGLDWDAEGNLYVSSYGGGVVKKYDSNGNDQGNFISSGLSGPTNIWFNEAGELLVANWGGTTVKRFDADGNFIDDFITGLGNPEGVAFFPNGNILIGNGGTSAVKMFDADGNFIEDIVESETLDLILPNAVVLRDVTPVSNQELEVVEADFIQPTIGTQFFLNTSQSQNIESIEIYNQIGMLIKSKTLSDHQIWNAANAPAGMYYVIAQLNTGNKIMQKVIVSQ